MVSWCMLRGTVALKSSVMPAGPGGKGTTPAIIWNNTTPRGTVISKAAYLPTVSIIRLADALQMVNTTLYKH